VAATLKPTQTVLVLAGSRAIFETYLQVGWETYLPQGQPYVEVGGFRFLLVKSPDDATGHPRETPFLLLPGWTGQPLAVLKAVLDHYETRFVRTEAS
jgi:hypothetical protein